MDSKSYSSLVLSVFLIAIINADEKLDKNYSQAVESFASKNRPPHIGKRGESRVAHFDAAFDWGDQQRIASSIEAVASHVEEAWPTLFENLGNPHYCITCHEHEFTVVRNLTVGDVCELIIQEALTSGYFEHLPRSHFLLIKLRKPLPLALKQEERINWFKERSKEPLFSLQIEMCEWAIKKLSDFPEVRQDDVARTTTEIGREIKRLQRTRQAIGNRAFFRPHGREVYTKGTLTTQSQHRRN